MLKAVSLQFSFSGLKWLLMLTMAWSLTGNHQFPREHDFFHLYIDSANHLVSEKCGHNRNACIEQITWEQELKLQRSESDDDTLSEQKFTHLSQHSMPQYELITPLFYKLHVSNVANRLLHWVDLKPTSRPDDQLEEVGNFLTRAPANFCVFTKEYSYSEVDLLFLDQLSAIIHSRLACKETASFFNSADDPSSTTRQPGLILEIEGWRLNRYAIIAEPPHSSASNAARNLMPDVAKFSAPTKGHNLLQILQSEYLRFHFHSEEASHFTAAIGRFSLAKFKPIIPNKWLKRVGIATLAAFMFSCLLGSWLVFLYGRQNAQDEEMDELDRSGRGSLATLGSIAVQHTTQSISHTQSILWAVAKNGLRRSRDPSLKTRGKFEIVGDEDEDDEEGDVENGLGDAENVEGGAGGNDDDEDDLHGNPLSRLVELSAISGDAPEKHAQKPFRSQD